MSYMPYMPHATKVLSKDIDDESSFHMSLNTLNFFLINRMMDVALREQWPYLLCNS